MSYATDSVFLDLHFRSPLISSYSGNEGWGTCHKSTLQRQWGIGRFHDPRENTIIWPSLCILRVYSGTPMFLQRHSGGKDS